KVICSCGNAGEGNIAQAVPGGCTDLKAVCEASGAGLGCGSCRPEVRAILIREVGARMEPAINNAGEDMVRSTAYIIHFRGGIVSAGQLQVILRLLTDSGVVNVRFGLRQDMIVNIPVKQERAFQEACRRDRIPAFIYADAPPNMVSSYAA